MFFLKSPFPGLHEPKGITGEGIWQGVNFDRIAAGFGTENLRIKQIPFGFGLLKT
jgi:hypothetical protein